MKNDCFYYYPFHSHMFVVRSKVDSNHRKFFDKIPYTEFLLLSYIIKLLLSTSKPLSKYTKIPCL